MVDEEQVAMAEVRLSPRHLFLICYQIFSAKCIRYFSSLCSSVQNSENDVVRSALEKRIHDLEAERQRSEEAVAKYKHRSEKLKK